LLVDSYCDLVHTRHFASVGYKFNIDA